MMDYVVYCWWVKQKCDLFYHHKKGNKRLNWNMSLFWIFSFWHLNCKCVDYRRQSTSRSAKSLNWNDSSLWRISRKIFSKCLSINTIFKLHVNRGIKYHTQVSKKCHAKQSIFVISYWRTRSDITCISISKAKCYGYINVFVTSF